MAKVMIEPKDAQNVRSLVRVAVENELKILKTGVAITYAYHYPDKTEKVIFRYDMAPHHKEIKTFPHHKHLGSEEVIESLAPSLAEVLHEIEGIVTLPRDSG
jgi:hypothetical protein